jgi:hypothetical protein
MPWVGQGGEKGGKGEMGRGKREEGRGKREEGRGRREEGRGKREEREEEKSENTHSLQGGINFHAQLPCDGFKNGAGLVYRKFRHCLWISSGVHQYYRHPSFFGNLAGIRN